MEGNFIFSKSLKGKIELILEVDCNELWSTYKIYK